MSSDDRDLALRCAARAKGHGEWKRAKCEACLLRTGKEDRRGNFGYHPRTRYFHCFRCAFRGRLSETEADALSFVVDTAPARDPQATVVVRPPVHYADIYAEPAWSDEAYDAARAYLRKRGIADDLGYSLGIGACARRCCPWVLPERRNQDDPQCVPGRTVVPIFDSLGQREWLGWVARDYTGKSMSPYLYARGMPRGVLLYNAEALHVETDEPALMVEGSFDAIALHPDGVGVLGKHGEPQVEMMLAARRPIVTVMDGDAHHLGLALAMRLRFGGQRAGTVRLPAGVDPDEVDPELLRRAARESLVHELW